MNRQGLNNLIKFKVPVLLLALLILQTQPAALFSAEKNHAAGLIWNTECAGLDYEYRFSDSFGMRVITLYVNGMELGENDYIYNAALAVFVHPAPRDSFIDPILFFGTDYSFHHWEHRFAGTEGTIHDLTVGGGAGIGFIFFERFRLGLNLWINYDYITEADYTKKYKGERFFLFIPVIGLSYLF